MVRNKTTETRREREGLDSLFSEQSTDAARTEWLLHRGRRDLSHRWKMIESVREFIRVELCDVRGEIK